MVSIIKPLLIIGLMTLAGCAHNDVAKPQRVSVAEYDQIIVRQKNSLSAPEFKQWLVKESKRLSEEREGIRGALYSTSERGSYQETMSSPTGTGGTGDFNIQMTNLELTRLQERLREIEGKMRTLDALRFAD